jgi:Nif-specific regulatory protein
MSTGKRRSVHSEVQELRLLLEVSRIVDSAPDLRDVLEPALRAIAKNGGMMRGTITLLDRETGEAAIEAAYGLSSSQRRRGRYRRGEGITGKVVETGKPMAAPRISEEPLFLNRTRAREGLRKKDVSFICVPIKIGKETIGALSVDRLFDESKSVEEDLRLLSIIASMLARAAKIRGSARDEQRRLLGENRRLQSELRHRFHPQNIIGNSSEMREALNLVEQVSSSNATVLIRGESGTGKELIARAIHTNSPRALKPHVKVNCAALPETMIESELFGHERGAFTGAVGMRKGRFELASGGTIFLDEIGYIPLATQVRLLRVLQEREFERVGGTKTIKCDVRVIAATNRDLEEMMRSGAFLQDLYYRLNVFPVHLPALRERPGDILMLADHFVEKYNEVHDKRIKRISTPAIDMMMAYHWPGNVRELENCIERAALLSNDEVIHGHHLPPTLQTAEASGTAPSGTLDETLDNVEREMLIEALKSSRGNCARAARALGLTERVMGLRVKKHGIAPKRFRTKR